MLYYSYYMEFFYKNCREKLIIFILAGISYFILTTLTLHFINFSACQDMFSLKLINCEIQGAFTFMLFPYYFLTTPSGAYLIGIFVIPWLIYVSLFILYTFIIYKYIFFRLQKRPAKTKK